MRQRRCVCNILHKKLKAAQGCYKIAEVKHLWNVVRSRTQKRAELLISELSDCFGSCMEHFCTY